MSQMAPEIAIVAALHSGDLQRAIEMLLESYQDDLYAYCARLVGVAEAMHIYHRVLSIAVEELGGGAFVAARQSAAVTLRAWLYGIARVTVTHHHRHEPRTYSEALSLDYAPSLGPRALGLPQDEALESALCSMTSDTREVLQLTLWHGLRVIEVAQVTSRTEGEVRCLLADGLSMVAALAGRGAPS